MKIFAVYNIKGGVGKTAAAVNLAYFSAKDNLKTLIWDLDPQGASTFYFSVKQKVKGGTKNLINAKELEEFIKATEIRNLDVLPSDFSYRNMDLILDDSKKSNKRFSILVEKLKDDYDALIFDSPPNISLVSQNLFHACDYIIVPVIPTTLSVRTYNQIVSYFRDENIEMSKILPFFSMVDRRRTMHRDIIKDGSIKNPLQNIIPYSSIVEKMGIYRAPVEMFAQSSIAAIAYRDLWNEIKIISELKTQTPILPPKPEGVLSKIFGSLLNS